PSDAARGMSVAIKSARRQLRSTKHQTFVFDLRGVGPSFLIFLNAAPRAPPSRVKSLAQRISASPPAHKPAPSTGGPTIEHFPRLAAGVRRHLKWLTSLEEDSADTSAKSAGSLSLASR